MNLTDFKVPPAVSNLLMKQAGKISNRRLMQAVELLEGLAAIRWHRRGFAAVKDYIAADHPGIQATRRILDAANPKARSALLNNFILGALLQGYKKRLDYYNRHGIAPPGTLMISPTLACNLKCYGCYAATHERMQELTFEEVDGILTAAGAAGTNFIIFLGGEPFMVPWLLDVIAKYPRMAFLIYTNGQLIDDAAVRRLAEMGNAGIAVGIDGFEAETDERKGPGAYQKALTVMRKLHRAGVIVGFSAMASRKNFDLLYSDAFIDTMIANGAGYGWIPIAVPQGRACLENDLVPTAEQKGRIRGLVKDLKARKPILLIDFMNDSELSEGCGAGRILLHINANGDVEPCVLMPFAVDNIRNKSFDEILHADFFKGLRDINRNFIHETQTCLWTYKPREVLQVVESCGAKETSKGVMEQLHALAEKQA